MSALKSLRLPAPGLAERARLGTAPALHLMRQTGWQTGSAGRRSDQPAACGVQLPLLAPMLAGVRLRSLPRGLEFVLPNPSGGRGVYIASWTVVTGFATPCLHDTLLVGRLSGLERIDPASVRDAARGLAGEGYAGIDAVDAARDVDASLRTAALRLGATLLMSLARRAGFTRPQDAARCLNRDGFHQLAQRLRWDGPVLAEALRGLSAHCATIATGCAAPAAGPAAGTAIAAPGGTAMPNRDGFGRWSVLSALVQRLRCALAEEQCASHGTDVALLGRIIAAADQCLREADRLMPEIEALLHDPLPLLEGWRDAGVRSAGWLAALEATFDGWDRICLLWFDADTARRRQAVIGEIAILTGTLGHGDCSLAMDEFFADADRGKHLLARNERLRVRELLLDLGPPERPA